MDTICKVLGHSQSYRPLRVTTPDGIEIAVQDWGQAGAGKRDILFIHGFSQTHLCWLKQVTSRLAEEFRLVTYDNRGHGMSEKPFAPAFFREPERWAGEVHAVIEQAGLRKPIIVAWSYSGRIALDYLSVYGDTGISGLVMTNATSKSDETVLGPATPTLRQMASADLGDAIVATHMLLDISTAQPLPPEERSLMLAYNMMTPPAIRAAMGGRPADYEATLRGLSVPVLAIHGTEDKINLPTMVEYTVNTVSRGRKLLYEGVGHIPFWEAPERFNNDLAEFACNLD